MRMLSLESLRQPYAVSNAAASCCDNIRSGSAHKRTNLKLCNDSARLGTSCPSAAPLKRVQAHGPKALCHETRLNNGRIPAPRAVVKCDSSRAILRTQYAISNTAASCCANIKPVPTHNRTKIRLCNESARLGTSCPSGAPFTRVQACGPQALCRRHVVGEVGE